HNGALRVHVEAPRRGNRHRRVEDVAELHHLAGADEPHGLEHGFGLHVVAGASLVGGSPLRGTALTVPCDQAILMMPGCSSLNRSATCGSWPAAIRFACPARVSVVSNAG